MHEARLASSIAGASALADETRRALYLYVCAQPHPVSRDQAADAVAVPVHTAKFHLDKLETAGLLRSSYARTSGRTGPGAGRSAKLYERSDVELDISLPAREYVLAGDLMAQAIARSSQGEDISSALRAVARERGALLAAEHDGEGTDADRAFDIAVTTLRALGYEPRVDGDRIVMANCPFHQLAGAHTQLICGMNHDMLSAFTDSVAPGVLRADLDPAPGRCCVTLCACSTPS
ncbi:helix-turn-helix transcriptional regulator [Paramicrobacterium agarici]|uniref:helix-turn-helix transcriptional regulator n=1 Tax=Paramicrobacterium agarici TaxID=630514 RepID=UPI0011528441|nr:helix-turn-helix domain-containing protein [Microbacterium agarici]TQO21803.1 putative ArsR family transcriptional regulator [Microbacterium agarici]